MNVFEKKVLKNASLYLLIDATNDGTKTETIAVAEVAFGHQHEINSVKADSRLGGWIAIDITEQIVIWSKDFNNGSEQIRRLQIYCTDCKKSGVVKKIMHTFIKVDLIDSEHVTK